MIKINLNYDEKKIEIENKLDTNKKEIQEKENEKLRKEIEKLKKRNWNIKWNWTTFEKIEEKNQIQEKEK